MADHNQNPSERSAPSPPEAKLDDPGAAEVSSLRYVLMIVIFAAGIIGMFAAYALVNPLVAVAIFWVLMVVAGYGFYRLLTADVRP